jgi:hypothetical protein
VDIVLRSSLTDQLTEFAKPCYFLIFDLGQLTGYAAIFTLSFISYIFRPDMSPGILLNDWEGSTPSPSGSNYQFHDAPALNTDGAEPIAIIGMGTFTFSPSPAEQSGKIHISKELVVISSF